ncbi:MAG TPA: hypothetical protein VFV65_06760 [Gemmatimonadales bacterium]|nr:hypothetical protein [Gemmatimonadales bacterium]
MPAHLFGVLALLGSALLLLLGVGAVAYGLARGDRRLAARAGVITTAYAAVYLVGVVLSILLSPRRVLPVGEEISFCGFDCHLHLSVVGADLTADRVSVAIQARSDAKQAPEYPRYLQFRLVARDGSLVAPVAVPAALNRPLEAGQVVVDTLAFQAPSGGAPYSLRIIYPDLPEGLLLGPANGRATGKTTLAIDGAAS